MKIIITCNGNSLEAPMDPRFGRAADFCLYDTETKAFEFLSNTQNLQAAQGAGTQAGQNVAKTGAKAVITGNVGPKAYQVLKQADIQIYLGQFDTVSQAIAAYESGQLQPTSNSNRDGHWM